MRMHLQNKIIYLVKSNLSYYPPCMSQIEMLADLGVSVEVWFGSSGETACERLDARGIPYKQLVDPRCDALGKLDVVYNWASFRRAVLRELKRECREDVLLWFGSGETAMPMIGALRGWRYVVSALELYDDVPVKRQLLGKIAKGATAVTACQLTRAYLMRQWWGLKQLPFVFPNKPYGLALQGKLPLTCERTHKVIEAIGDKPFVLYQGILQNEQYVAEIANALAAMNRDIAFVMLGIDRTGMAPRIKQIYKNTLYFESIPAPLHLEVTSRAAIGVVFYDGANLNKAFCAPNKIYEYSAFGLPMLANDIPGLLGTVGAYGAAECVSLTCEEIAVAFERMFANYQAYSDNAKRFYRDTDNVATMKRLLSFLEDGC